MPNHWVEQFLEMMCAQYRSSTHTTSAYKSDLKDFLTICKKDLKNVEEKDIIDYLAYLHQKSYCMSTVNRRLSVLNQFFNFLKTEELIHLNPVMHLDRPKKKRTIPQVMTQDEVLLLIESIIKQPDPKNIRLAALLDLLYSTGLRVTELLTLPLKSVLYNKQTNQWIDHLLIKGKGGKERIVYLSPPALKALQSYLDVRHVFLLRAGERGQKWLFPSNSQEGHLTRQRLGQLLKHQAFVAGIDPNLVHPHALRHAFATHMLQNGAEITIIQKLLGHEDITTTQIYTHVISNELVDLLETHHPLCISHKNFNLKI